MRIDENISNRFRKYPAKRGTSRNRNPRDLLEVQVKLWKAIVSDDCSFNVIGATKAIAYANAVNTAALLFLEYGLVLRIREVVEA